MCIVLLTLGRIGLLVMLFPSIFWTAVLTLPFLLPAAGFQFAILHRAWQAIQGGPVRTTPEKAIGLLFLPFINLYWNFMAVRGLVQDMNGYAVDQRVPMRPQSDGLALTCCSFAIPAFLFWPVPILGPLVGIVSSILLLILMYQVKEGMRAITLVRDPAAQFAPSGLGALPWWKRLKLPAGAATGGLSTTVLLGGFLYMRNVRKHQRDQIQNLNPKTAPLVSPRASAHSR